MPEVGCVADDSMDRHLRDLDALLRSTGDAPVDRRGCRGHPLVGECGRAGLDRALDRRAEIVQDSKRRELTERGKARPKPCEPCSPISSVRSRPTSIACY